MSALISVPSRKGPARKLATVIAVGAVSTLALSACSSSGTAGGGGTGGTGAKTPIEALDAGVSKLTTEKSFALDLTAKPDAAVIAQMAKSDPTSGPVLQKVLGNGGLEFKIGVSADKPLKDLKAGDTPNTDVDIRVGGKDMIDLRVVKGALYLKVDVPDALAIGGVPNSVVTGELAKLPPDAQGPAQALASGGWVTVSAADLQSIMQLAGSLGGGDLTPTAGGGAGALGPQAAQQFTQALLSALTKDTQVKDLGGGHLQVTGQVKTIAQDVLQASSQLTSMLPGSSKTDLNKAKDGLAGIPDSATVTFDARLQNGALTELSMDLAQFAPPAQTNGGHFPLDLKFTDNAGSISAPSGATPVDIKKLISSFGAGM